MISYVMVGTNDLPRATLFFAPLMDMLGAQKVHEGDPGLRGEKLYVAYFRDLDGNKFNAICYL